MQQLMVILGLLSALWSRETTISMKALGLSPNSGLDAVTYVNRALESARGKGPAVIVFEKGRYEFWPQHSVAKDYYESNTTIVNPRRCPIFIENQQDLTIEGNGALFVFHDRVQPFTIDGSERITIRNLSIDWDVPLGAEAEIVAVGPTSIDLHIDPRLYPYEVADGRLYFLGEGWRNEWGGVKWNDPMEFDRETLGVVPGTGDEVSLGNDWAKYRATALRDGLVRISHSFQRLPAKGNFLVLRHGVRDHSGVFITGSKDIQIERVDMHGSAGLAFLAQFTENITYRQVNCIPNPAKRRILSVHDDGFHFSNCRGRLVMDSCRFAGLMDDSINVHGTAIRVRQRLGDRALVGQFMHHQSKGFAWARPGDRISLIQSGPMQPLATVTVATFQLRSPDLFDITFLEPLPSEIAPGYAMENLTWTPDVTIRHCAFGNHRARGILVSTPGKVLIERNTFESSGSAILIAGDANYWYETGAVSDVTIRDNAFKESCLTSMYQFSDGIISIEPEIPELDPAKPSFHRNIRILNNTFEPFDYPVLYAKSVDGITFAGNRIDRSRRYQPFHARKSTLTFEACRRVEVRDNIVGRDVLGKNISLVRMGAGELALGGKQDLKVEAPAR